VFRTPYYGDLVSVGGVDGVTVSEGVGVLDGMSVGVYEGVEVRV
jgi:hypothetical protein